MEEAAVYGEVIRPLRIAATISVAALSLFETNLVEIGLIVAVVLIFSEM